MKNDEKLTAMSIEKRAKTMDEALDEIKRLRDEGNIAESQKLKKALNKWIKQGRPVLVLEKNEKIIKTGGTQCMN